MLTHEQCETISLHGMLWKRSQVYFCVYREALKSSKQVNTVTVLNSDSANVSEDQITTFRNTHTEENTIVVKFQGTPVTKKDISVAS
jgi:hypothetical protein